MHPIKGAIWTAMLLSLAVAAHAQETDSIKLPKECEAVVPDMKSAPKMQNVQTQMHSEMQKRMQEMQKMTETQRGILRAMMDMNGPMMNGMMAKDADVAWICSMIPHHAGAIAMARAGLRQASDPASRRLAQQTIKENELGIKKLTAWVKRHAKKEAR